MSLSSCYARTGLAAPSIGGHSTMHPYYEETFGWTADDFPVATAQWQRLISLPIFPGMTPAELAHVVGVVRRLCQRHAVAQRPKETSPVRAR